MTTAPAVYGEFGQAVAFAERTLTAVLREHLAARDTKPETWYALQLLATRGPRLDRDALTRDLGGSRNLDAESARDVLDRMAADGLIEGDRQLDLTPAGTALHGDLRAYVLGATTALLGQFETSDVETTVRTLQAIASRAVPEELTV